MSMVLGCKLCKEENLNDKRTHFQLKLWIQLNSFSIASCHLKLMYTALIPNKIIIE